MTDSDVGLSAPRSITIDLDGARLVELCRWATIGRQTVEETVLAAIDEYITPVETEAHGRHPQVGCRQPGAE